MTLIISSVLFILLLYRSVESVNPRFYPKFHLAPPQGWMNDPNGFCIFKNEYHLFYQFNPNSSRVPGTAHWGHAKSVDMINWTHLPIAMSPDKDYDRNGVFSGSALVENNTMYLFYTGNVNHEGQTPDHEQHQALAWSHDGITVTKYEGNPIIPGSNRQPNFRDPKVWKHNDTYYMVLGNSYENDTLGRVLLYSSTDMYHWEEISILDQSFGFLGYMWECPDFFELDGIFVLLFSPQGVKRQGIKFNNLYQNGYFVGTFDYHTHKFTQMTEFRELDFGHDFYATQTIEDKDGNRIMTAWQDMWEQDYPERNDGFTGQMIIPRILKLDCQLRLIQEPIPQIQNAVGKKLYSGKTFCDTVVKLEGNIGKIDIRALGCENLTFIIEANGKPAVTISYDYDRGLVTLDRGGKDGKRSTRWRPLKNKENMHASIKEEDLHWELFIDASSVELFIGKGERSFTSRYYPDGDVSVRMEEKCQSAEMTVYSMKQTVPAPAKS